MEQTPESNNRIENLNELGNAIQQFEEEKGKESSLESFLEQNVSPLSQLICS